MLYIYYIGAVQSTYIRDTISKLTAMDTILLAILVIFVLILIFRYKWGSNGEWGGWGIESAVLGNIHGSKQMGTGMTTVPTAYFSHATQR